MKMAELLLEREEKNIIVKEFIEIYNISKTSQGVRDDI